MLFTLEFLFGSLFLPREDKDPFVKSNISNI